VPEINIAKVKVPKNTSQKVGKKIFKNNEADDDIRLILLTGSLFLLLGNHSLGDNDTYFIEDK
jgi:hypothetical protein